MLRLLFSSLIFTLFIFVLTGLIYPFAITGLAQSILPKQANGSLITSAGKKIIGSELIGQTFTLPQYFHPRPSVNHYDAANSGGSNLGPTSKKLMDAVKLNRDSYIKENNLSGSAAASIPVDAVTTSASGLDPNISLANALLQSTRIAKARHVAPEKIQKLIYTHKESGFFSEAPYINVLKLNRVLDMTNE